MKNGRGEVRDANSPSVTEQIAEKLKELAQSPRDIIYKSKEDRIDRKMEADKIAIERLAMQRGCLAGLSTLLQNVRRFK